MLKDHITPLNAMFDVIALSENWLNDNSRDTLNLDGYDFCQKVSIIVLKL